MEVNGIRDFRGSLSLRAEETESGFRFFLEDDEESFFDLNLESAVDSEFEFQTAAPQVLRTAEELFRNSRILPLQSTSSPNSQAKENTARFLVRFPSPRLLSPLRERSQSEKGKLVGCFFGCLQIRKKKKNNNNNKKPVHSGSAIELEEPIFVKTILDAVDFAVRSGRWGRTERWAEVAVERNRAINSAIDHCKMSYSGASSPR